MAVRNYSNITNVGSLSGAVGTGETTLPISGGWSNLPAFPFYIIVDRGNSLEECMLATGGNATALDVTRGYDGSAPASHGISATVEVAVLAEFFAKADQHVEASTNAHGLSGGAAVVGTTQTQTVTNKTINASIVSLAHSTSPAATQAVQVAADAATARDGFVWSKTAGATGAAFKAVSTGTTRFTVDADGKVQLNSTAGADKALSIQQSGTERTFIQNDGTADFGLQAAASAGDRVTIRARATQAALRIKDDAAVNMFTVGPTGNVDAAGTVTAPTITATGALSSGTTTSVGSNLTVGGTAAVTGASTLTGDSTWPLPAASVTPRLTINSRTTGVALRSIRQDGTVTYEIGADGGGVANGKWFIHDKNSPVMASVTGTAQVPTPVNGMIVHDNSDNLIKRYNGSTWPVIADARIGMSCGLYANTATQSIPHATVTKVLFPTDVDTSPDISKATVGAGSEFTLNRAGWWRITANGTQAGSTAGTTRIWWLADVDDNPRYVTQALAPAGFFMGYSVTLLRPFAAGDKVSAFIYQDSGGALNTDPAQGAINIAFEWVGLAV
jgi:hypothetical protein